MDENPYRSPERPDEQERPAQPQPYYGIPGWVIDVMAIIALIGSLMALLWPAVQ